MTRVNTPLRRMFGIPGMTSVHMGVAVGAQAGVAGAGPPPGKGVFVRSLELHVNSPEALVERAKWAGLSWVPILTLWQYDTQPPATANAQAAGGGPQTPPFFHKAFNQDIGAYASALASAGIQPWLWGYAIARPDAVDQFTQVLGALAVHTGAAGIIVDVENSWRQGGADGLATNLIAGLRKQSGGRPIGMMSYGDPNAYPQLPWAIFAQLTDFGAPQAFDPEGKHGPDFAAKAVASYAEKGFRSVIPILPAFGAHGDDGAAIRTAVSNTPAPGSLLFWDWFSVSEKSGRWEAIRAVELGPSVQQVSQ